MRPLAPLLLLVLAAPSGRGEEAPPFREVAVERGIDWKHQNAFSGRRHIVEITGSGAGFVDWDSDGDLDVVLLNGGALPGTPRDAVPGPTGLFLNDGTGSFSPAEPPAALERLGFGMGIAAGDVDGDGDVDLHFTSYGPDVFLRNLGGGRWEDATAEAGLADDRWTTSAVFLDYDLDGDLDLYVAAYVDYGPHTVKDCSSRGVPAYCGPDSFEGIPDRLYRNDGSGHFEDVSAEAGIAEHAMKGLGVVAGDLDGDGAPDVYVADDGTANLLFINQLRSGEARFAEEGLFWGVAYGRDARAEAGMGTDMGDFDGDGDLDVVCTNLDGETNALYRNDGEESFVESSYGTGLGASSLPWVGFGIRFLDYDSDGDLDLIVANGHISDNIGLVHQGKTFEQRMMLFANEGGRFSEVCAGCLPAAVGRGLATGDVDDDGDTDVLVNSNDRHAILLENVAPRAGPVVGLRLEGAAPGSPRDAVGARVTWSRGEQRLMRDVRAGASFCSTSDSRLLLALEPEQREASVEVLWPDGSRESLTLEAGKYHHVAQGRGVVSSTPFRPPAAP